MALEYQIASGGKLTVDEVQNALCNLFGIEKITLASISTARPSPNISRPGRWEIPAFIGFFVC